MKRQYPAPDERRCNHINEAGQRCAQWTMKGRESCPSHTPEIKEKLRGNSKGMLEGNQNGYKAGGYQKPLKRLSTLEDVLDDLLIHHSQLSLAITEKGEALPLETLARVVSLQAANALRIARIMKEQRSRQPDQGLSFLYPVLDELSEEWGIKL